MARPFVLAQLSDFHIGAEWGGGDPVAGLASAVGTIQAMPTLPGALLVSGDLVDHGADEEYALVRELLAPLPVPLHVLPGNHDDRRALHRHFGVPGERGEPVQYSVDLGPLRLVVLDTTIPGEDPGALDAERIDWLDAELAAAPAAPTLLAMHHPPLVTGVAECDQFGLPAPDRRALAAVLERHPQVQRLVGGHLHGPMVARLAGRTVLTVPSTYVQMRVDPVADAVELAAGPAGFALHTVVDGEIVSHLRPIDGV